MMKIIGSPLALPRVTGAVVPQVLRIGLLEQEGSECGGNVKQNKFDIILDNVFEREPEQITALIRAGFFRNVIISSEIESPLKDRLEVAVMSGGASVTVLNLIPPLPVPSLYGVKISRGGMGRAVRDICHHLSAYRTLWRTNGTVAILEWPIDTQPWLRPLDLAEIEIILDDLSIETDNSGGEAGYLINRAAHAVYAALPSYLPPAGSVTIARDGRTAGYDAKSETICVIGMER